MAPAASLAQITPAKAGILPKPFCLRRGDDSCLGCESICRIDLPPLRYAATSPFPIFIDPAADQTRQVIDGLRHRCAIQTATIVTLLILDLALALMLIGAGAGWLSPA